MRILLKVLLFPVTLILMLAVNVSAFLVGGIGFLLNVVSGLLFTIAVLMCGLAIYDSHTYTWQPVIVSAVVSFIMSPYGVPKVAVWLVVKLNELNDLIKAI